MAISMDTNSFFLQQSTASASNARADKLSSSLSNLENGTAGCTAIRRYGASILPTVSGNLYQASSHATANRYIRKALRRGGQTWNKKMINN